MSDNWLPKRRRVALPLAGAAAVAMAVSASFVDLSTAADESVSRPAAAVETAPGAPSFADIVERVSPAVVNIEVAKLARPMPTQSIPGFPGRQGSPLDEFFGRFFDQPGFQGRPGFPQQQPQPQPRRGAGSGFVVDADGYIVTNHHVVEGAEEIVVTMQSGEKLDAELVGQDPKTDLALLKVDAADDLVYLEFGDSDAARIGDWVLAIGNPFGLGGSATAGIISARGRDIQSGPYDDYLQIDAPINSGNSGGPVFNGQGRVIGVNTAIFSPNGGNVGIGFAIPANQARGVVEQLKETGSVDRAWLGVQIQDVNGDIAQALGLERAEGALVAEVLANSPAASAGLEAGDVVVEFDGRAVDSAKSLSRAVGETGAGADASVTVWRDGQRHELAVDLGDAARAETAARAPSGGGDGQAQDGLGLGLQDLTETERRALGLPADVHGALVARVDPNGPAAAEGLQPGDVIVQVNRRKVGSAREALGALDAAARANGKALVLVRRGEAQHFVAIDLA